MLVDGVPDRGTTLVTGPSGVGKTRLTYAALTEWVERRGADGVVVLEFAPELERGGRLLGGRLSRFGPLPDCRVGTVDAAAPRAESETADEASALARKNAARAAEVVEAVLADVTDPTAVFVNDATIPFQHPDGDPARLLAYCRRADCAVLNAFESDELGTDDPVSRCERRALDALAAAADARVELAAD